MKQRVLAIAGAVILVCVAVLVREALVADDDGGGGGGGGGGRDRAPVVACTPDLASVCEALADAGTIAAEPPTLDLASAADPPEQLDGWITWDPAPRVANYAAGDPIWDPAEPVAQAPLAVLVTADGLDPSCTATATWICVFDAARDASAVGVGDPGTAEGLARLAPLVRAADTDDFDLLARATGEAVDGPTRGQASAATAAQQLVTAPGALDAAVVARGLADAQAGTAQGTARKVRVLAPLPNATATVVVAPTVDGVPPSSDEICADAAEALESLGLVPCAGSEMEEFLAGLLFQVHDRLG